MFILTLNVFQSGTQLFSYGGRERGGGVVFVREVVLLVLIKETVSVIWSDILAMFLS